MNVSTLLSGNQFGIYSQFVDSDDEDENGEISYGTIRGNLVGIRYYKGRVNNRELVSLRREPRNPYDRNAIRVDNVYGEQVGHIKRELAAVLSQLVDKKLAKIEGIVPFGSHNKFSMPCDITLRGPPEHAEQCKRVMESRGYLLKTFIDERYSDGGVWRNPDNQFQNSSFQSKKKTKTANTSSFKAKGNSTRELVKLDSDMMKNELDSLFEKLQSSDKQKTMEPCNALKTNLFVHQKQALCWMASCENNDNLPPFWTKDNDNWYKNSITNFATRLKPASVNGGVLADDMGLGKTLSIISLILTNFRKNKPLIVLNKSVKKEITVKVQKRSRKQSTKRKTQNSVALQSLEKKLNNKNDSGSDDEMDEPELPSFESIEDVEYKPLASLNESEGQLLPTKRPRSVRKKPRYNFDEDDWLVGETSRPPTKQKCKVNEVTETTTDAEMIIQNVHIPSKVKEADQTESTTVACYEVMKTEIAGPRATLIVCPLSVLYNWQEQFSTHVETGALDVYTYYGSDRIKDTKLLSGKDVVLTTYQTLSSDFSNKTDSTLTDTCWLRVVLDEGHCIRNIKSNQSKACHALKAERRWLVTGTPIQNSMKDLWSMVSFLRIEPFVSKKEWWSRTIHRPIANGETAALKRLQLLMEMIAMRRTKYQKINGKSVLQLPARNVYVQKIEFSEQERKLYNTFKNEGKAIMERYMKEKMLLENYANVLVILMRLRQLCCHPKLCAQILELVSGVCSNSSDTPGELQKKLQQILSVLLSSGNEECPICLDSLNQPVITHCAHLYCRPCIENVIKTDHRGSAKCPMCRRDIAKNQLVEPAKDSLSDVTSAEDDTWSSSSKVDALITLLNKERNESSRRKSLVVSQFSAFLDLLETPLKDSGHHFVRLDGSMSMKQRVDVIQLFSERTTDSPTVMLLSLKAGGVGLNLMVATRVFLMEPAWNPSAEDQCFDRCHRLGQTEDVNIYKFVVQDTVEERMLELQKQKRELMARAFGRKMTAADQKQRRMLDVQHLFS